MAESEGIPVLVAAIDFGTSFSGFAYSSRTDFEENPRKIWTNDGRISGSGSIMSLKEPTCLLLNSNKEFVAFGYNAENEYGNIAADDKQQDFYLFKRFKMKLYEAYLFEEAFGGIIEYVNALLALHSLFLSLIHNRRPTGYKPILSPSMNATEIGGKTMSAIDVFALSIQAMVQDLEKKLTKHGKLSEDGGKDFGMKDVRWVLTVPAIWSDKAKKFMRKAALKAGIPEKNLLIALEPECASIFCQYEQLAKKGEEGHGFNVTVPGTKYMVVDLGGGTVDIAVHEKLVDGGLKELSRANGSNCGGTSVDDKFLMFLCSVFGKDLISKLKKDHPESFLLLTRSFEAQKRKFDMSTLDKKISIDLPYSSLNELCGSFHGKSLDMVIIESEAKEHVNYRHGHLRIVGSFFHSFYKEALDKLNLLLNNTFDDPRVKGVMNIILVGGFAESELVQQSVKEWFKDKNVMLPEEASLAVLKGAVLFGHKQTYITERVLKFTYGISGLKPFDHTTHKRNQVQTIDGKEYATNIFHLIVKNGTSVKLGSEYFVKFSTISPFQRYIKIVLHLSKSDETVYTDEDKCFETDKTMIKVPTPKKDRQIVTVAFSFGETEIAIRTVKSEKNESGSVVNFDDTDEIFSDVCFEPLLIDY